MIAKTFCEDIRNLVWSNTRGRVRLLAAVVSDEADRTQSAHLSLFDGIYAADPRMPVPGYGTISFCQASRGPTASLPRASINVHRGGER